MGNGREGFVKALVEEIDRSLKPYLASHSADLITHLSVWKAAHGDDSLPEEVKWELLALDVRAVDRDKRQNALDSRFSSMWEIKNDKVNPPVIEVYPDVAGLLGNEQAVAYYRKRLQESQNPIRKARYADLAWVPMQRQGGVEFYRQGMETARAYLEEAELWLKQSSVEHAYLYLVKSADRAAEIAVQLNARDFLSEFVGKAGEFLSDIPSPDFYRWVLDIGNTLLFIEKKFRSLVSEASWLKVHEIAVEGVRYYDAQEDRNFLILHDLMDLASQVSSHLKDAEAAWCYRVQVAESFEKQSRSRENKEGVSGGGLAALLFMEQAMRIYQQLTSRAPNAEEKQRLQVKVEETKREIRRLIRQTEKEMKATSVIFQFPPETQKVLENAIEKLLQVDPADTLKLLICQ